MKTTKIHKPDDWHLHLRDGDMLKGVIQYSANFFGRALIMPNLVPPVTTVDMAKKYKQRIFDALGGESEQFEPLMTLYLTQTTDPNQITKAVEDGCVKAAKLYPAGATTNSDAGVQDVKGIYPVLERMAEVGLPLCVHGEVTYGDIFDREKIFVNEILEPMRKKIPNLRVVMEHVTTKEGVEYVKQNKHNMGATITPHHMVINRNHILSGGIRPHYYCLPIAKREEHRLALREAAVSDDNDTFFLGTDSAPHLRSDKQSECGCAGCFVSPNTISILAHIFEEHNALNNLEKFTSVNGANFYGLPVNKETMTIKKMDEPVQFPDKIKTKNGEVVVFDPNFDLFWMVEEK